MAEMQVKQTQEIQGQFTTAEITHTMKALELEGQCYLKNHLLMKLCGTEGAIREWHDNVTRPNLERLTGVAQEIGIPLPFAKKLEDRENEIKDRLQGQNVAGVLTEGEGLREIRSAAMLLSEFYVTSLNLATHDTVKDAFRRGFENVADNIQRIDQAMKNTENYFPPPVAKQIGFVNEKGVQARK